MLGSFGPRGLPQVDVLSVVETWLLLFLFLCVRGLFSSEVVCFSLFLFFFWVVLLFCFVSFVFSVEVVILLSIYVVLSL